MRDAARVQSAIELIAEIETAMVAAALPADALISSYFRTRRYAGSKDRRSVIERVYSVLRQREALVWMLESVEATVDARNLMIASFVYTDAPLDLFAGSETHGPAVLTDEDSNMVARLSTLDLSTMPAYAKANLPAWAVPHFEARFGDKSAEEATAFNERASLDIRANNLRTTRTLIMPGLKEDKLELVNGRFAPTCMRSVNYVSLQNVPAYMDGYIEIQDEAAQIASLLVEAKPGQKVFDLCAGGGGKTLAMASVMRNQSELVATDTHARRLKDLTARADRSGVKNLTVHQLPLKGAERREWLEGYERTMDRVVLDVPCSGSGTWRRNPDQRWRLNDERLAELQSTQLGLLREGQELVKVGGRLVYMTCSLLAAENEEAIASFLAENTKFKALSWSKVWATVAPDSDVPVSAALDDNYLQLTPAAHGTDGFFVAILERLS